MHINSRSNQSTVHQNIINNLGELIHCLDLKLIKMKFPQRQIITTDPFTYPVFSCKMVLEGTNSKEVRQRTNRCKEQKMQGLFCHIQVVYDALVNKSVLLL